MPIEFWLSILSGLLAAGTVLLAVRVGRITYELGARVSYRFISRRARSVFKEAEKALALNNETAAIVLGFAALEAALLKGTPVQSQRLPLTDLIQRAADTGLIRPEQREVLIRLNEKRNQIVHPTAAGLGLQGDAESYLRDVQHLLDEISTGSKRK